MGGSKTTKLVNVFSHGCLLQYSIFNNVMYFASKTTAQDSNTILFLHTHINFGNSPLIVEKNLIFGKGRHIHLLYYTREGVRSSNVEYNTQGSFSPG